MSTAYTVGSHLYISHSVTLWWWNYIKIQYKLKIKGVSVEICLCSRIYFCCYFISTIIQRKFLDFKKEKLKPIIVNEEPIKIKKFSFHPVFTVYIWCKKEQNAKLFLSYIFNYFFTLCDWRDTETLWNYIISTLLKCSGLSLLLLS